MADSFTEVSSENWFSRLGGSFKGILAGLVMIPLAVILLWWNEGRAVTTANSLKEGAAAVVSVSADKVDPANEKKLIHISGEAKSDGPVVDETFHLSVPALRLTRSETIYQWVENKKSEKRQKVGGSEETVTTYTYEKEWVDKPVNSSNFKQAADHANRGALIAGAASFNAAQVTLGPFAVPGSFVSRMGSPVPHAVTDADFAKLAPDLKAGGKVHAGVFYFGARPEAPEIGDRQVAFSAVKPGAFSILAQQSGTTLAPYQTKAGDAIAFIEAGTVSADSMFKAAASANSVMTWLFRFGGFLLMSFGFMAVLRPLSVLGSVIPFIGSIIGAGTGFIAFVLSAAISLVVIAVAWIVVRPVLGIALLALAVGGFIYLRKRAAAGRVQAAAAA